MIAVPGAGNGSGAGAGNGSATGNDRCADESRKKKKFVVS